MVADAVALIWSMAAGCPLQVGIVWATASKILSLVLMAGFYSWKRTRLKMVDRVARVDELEISSAGNR